LNKESLKEFLDRKVKEYNSPGFIPSDPVSVPHRFSVKQDIEIAGFFAAIFSWGNRATIIKKSLELMRLMDDSPYQFILGHQEKDLRRMESFCHRTFNATDLLYFIAFMHHHYSKHKSLEAAFIPKEIDTDREWMEQSLNNFYDRFFSLEDVPARTRKHVAAPYRNSGCKRINMFVRWMVRKDNAGVDFGIWNEIAQADLICPIDVHVARVARRVGLLDRPNADWQGALNLTRQLRLFDPADPAKYDFALFALGVIEKF
jgi:uncharacterized protein (TIGR02757 family)